MPHARRLIVLAAVQALGTLPTIPAAKVKPGRAAPMPVAQAPYLLVYGRRERAGPVSGSGATRKLQRELTLRVEAVTTGDDDDALVDQVAAEVEAALMADNTLGRVCKDLYLSATDLDARAEGETRLGRAWLDFTVIYFTAANAPETAL
jgi:hypothetical protein